VHAPTRTFHFCDSGVAAVGGLQLGFGINLALVSQAERYLSQRARLRDPPEARQGARDADSMKDIPVILKTTCLILTERDTRLYSVTNSAILPERVSLVTLPRKEIVIAIRFDRG